MKALTTAVFWPSRMEKNIIVFFLFLILFGVYLYYGDGSFYKDLSPLLPLCLQNNQKQIQFRQRPIRAFMAGMRKIIDIPPRLTLGFFLEVMGILSVNKMCYA